MSSTTKTCCDWCGGEMPSSEKGQHGGLFESNSPVHKLVGNCTVKPDICMACRKIVKGAMTETLITVYEAMARLKELRSGER